MKSITDKEKAFSSFMLIATLMSFISPNEATRKTNKLRKLLRRSIVGLESFNNSLYKTCSGYSNRAWEYAKEEIGDQNYTINISSSCRALYALLDGNPYQNIWFSNTVFEKAMASIDGRQKKADEVEVDIESSSNVLVDLFANYLDIKRINKLGVLKKTIEYNLILENKGK